MLVSRFESLLSMYGGGAFPFRKLIPQKNTLNVGSPVSAVVSVGQRTCRAWMPAGCDLNISPACGRSVPVLWRVERQSCSFLGVLTDADDSVDAHDVDDLTQVVVAGFQHRFNQLLRKIVRGDVLSSLAQQQSGQWFTTNRFEKVASGVPYIASIKFHNLVPETSWRSRSRPTMGRLG